MDRIINMIGVFSIVGSLIFVGLELRQSHTIALATQVQARVEQQLDRNRTWFEGQWELGYKVATTPYEELNDAGKMGCRSRYVLDTTDARKQFLSILDWPIG